jgi:Domain of unknown function (DUF6456)
MSTADRAGRPDAATLSDALKALSRLAAKDAYAAPLEGALGAGERFGVFSARDGQAQPVATLPGSAVVLACRRGWLARDAGTDRYRIAAAGIEALRRARNGASIGAAKARPSSRSARRSEPRAAAPARGAHEGPLAWLRRRKDKGGQRLITEPQFAAGERLAADFLRAQLAPRVTANWSGVVPGRRMRRAAPGVGVEQSDIAVAARARVHRALAAVGPELAGILLDVCCFDVGLEAAERAQRWPQRAGKVVLQLALTGLARHYGLLAPEPPPGAHRLRHWGSDDYRPNLDVWRS